MPKENQVGYDYTKKGVDSIAESFGVTNERANEIGNIIIVKAKEITRDKKANVKDIIEAGLEEANNLNEQGLALLLSGQIIAQLYANREHLSQVMRELSK